MTQQTDTLSRASLKEFLEKSIKETQLALAKSVVRFMEMKDAKKNTDKVRAIEESFKIEGRHDQLHELLEWVDNDEVH